MANVSNSSGVFTGINELHVVPGGFADGFTLPTGVTAPTEIPVAEESGFSYSGGTPSIERYRIHGLSAPWASKMTPGEAECNIFVPQVTAALLSLFGYTSASATATVLSKDWTGVKFSEAPHEVLLGIAAINRTVDQLFAVKRVKVLASLVFDDANSAKPIGFQLTGVADAGADTDAIGIFSLDTE